MKQNCCSSAASHALNASAVRERAKSIEGCHEIPGQGIHVVSFLVSSNNHYHNNEKDAAGNSFAEVPARRVNIFVDSGTIGTCKVMNGQVRQSFRRHVTSLDVVERLLKHPEGPMEINESLIGLTDTDDDEDDNNATSADKYLTEVQRIAARLSSPTTIQKELELAEVGMCILQGEREKLEKHLQHLEQPEETTVSLHSRNFATASANPGVIAPFSTINGKDKNFAEEVRSLDQTHGEEDDDGMPRDDDDDGDGEPTEEASSSGSSVHGSEFHFKLPTEDVMKQVDQCLKDIAKMNKVVKGVSTNGKGTVFLYGNGGVAYTPSIPKALYQKLRQLRSSSYSSRPCSVALGTRDRYFVAFNDGTADWKGPNALDKILKKSLAAAKMPRSVAFGGTYDTFFIVFHDGSWQYQGRGIPETLEEKLASRDDRADLVTVNLGPNGEWFLKAENGRMWWSGITQELDEVLANILREGYLHSMDFGENGSFFVTYEQE